MKTIIRRASVIILVSMVVTAGLSVSTFAHVVVTPNEVVTAGYNTYVVSVPTEKAVATTSVRLDVPVSVAYVTPTQKTGWTIQLDKTPSGAVQSVTWTGNIEPGMRDEFSFTAKAPDTPQEIQWKAYQTYADGTVVSWDKVADTGDTEAADSGPLSVTKVTSVLSQTSAADESSKTAHDALDWSRRSFYAAIASLVVGLVALSVALHKRG